MAVQCPERLIFMGQDLDEMIADEVTAYLYLLDTEEATEIPFLLDCSRGSLEAGLALYEAMQRVHADITTFCVGDASAVTALVLSSGARGKRYIHPTARVCLAPFVTPVSGAIVPAEVTLLTDSLAHLLSANTGRPKAQIQADMKMGRTLTPDESVAYGLADHIMDMS
jgi:ATP-dependent Clp protease protease subunit